MKSYSFLSTRISVHQHLRAAVLVTILKVKLYALAIVRKQELQISTIVSSMYDKHTSARRASEESWSKIGTDRDKRSLRSQSLYAQEARIPCEKNQTQKPKRL